MILLNVDHDEPITPERERYWQALGRFIHKFAIIEHQVAFALALYAKTPKGTAQAVFSGVRAGLALSLIDRIREARGAPADEDWNRAKGQFGIINSVRNDIVHFGALAESEGAFQISNANRTIPSQAKVTPITADELDMMTDDLRTISETIFAHQLVESGTEKGDKRANAARERGRAPWKYKPPRQARAQDKRRDN
jgi:hypothetical protein